VFVPVTWMLERINARIPSALPGHHFVGDNRRAVVANHDAGARIIYHLTAGQL